jgi:hypothetical protein
VKNKLPVAVIAIYFFICLVNSGALLFAQGDNPLVDAIPQEWIQNINYSDSELDVITTPDGFDNFNLGVDFAEPHLSQNPNNPLQYFNAFNTNGAWRTSNGHDWTHSAPPFGTSTAGDPVTAYDSLGNLYYENMYGSITGCKVIVSTNNGDTWSTAVTSILGSDKNWIAADQTAGPYANYVYTSMTRPGGGGQVVARSTNFGATWTQTGSFTNSSLPGTMVAVGPNVIGGDVPGGAVYLVLNTGGAFSSVYSFYVSTDGGATWTFKSNQFFSGYVGTNVNGRNSVQNMRTRPYPFITADNSYGSNRGRLYLVYASNSPAGNGNKPDIFCRYSDDQGVTWSTAVTVNDDVNSQNNNQWHPSIWCDKQTGRLFVKWMDTRDTPTSDSAYIYASYSDDGGLTFMPDQRISNAKMKINCSTCGGGGTPRYQGDYDAIVSLDGQSLAVWTDFRAGNFGSYVGYFPDYAMLVSPSNPVIDNTNGTALVTVEVPDVKLYSDVVSFSATLNTNPPSGTLNLTFPSGNTLGTFPGSVDLQITTTGTVTNGDYEITIVGEGPNGTPVHKRTVVLTVQDPVPVELTMFTAYQVNDKIRLTWTTATETNNQGFEIERKENTEFQKIGFVPGHGSTTKVQDYVFVDDEIASGKYSYRLKQIDYDGTTVYSNVVEVDITEPVDYQLSQNYPNPFNPTTTISYTIPKDGFVALKVFDVLGNEVETLVNEFQTSGRVNITFDASSLSSGVYYYKLVSGEFTSIKKLILMK